MIRFVLAFSLCMTYPLCAQELAEQFAELRGADVKDFCITPSSRYVYTVTQNKISLFELFTGRLIHSTELDSVEGIRSIAINSDSTFMIAGTDNGSVVIFDLIDDGVFSKNISKNPVTSIAINGLSSLIAMGTSGGEIILTDLNEGLPETLWPHNKTVTDIQFSSDGELLVSSGMDGRVIITEIAEDKSFYTLQKEMSPCRDISINKEATRILAAYDNGKVYKWNILGDKSVVLEKKIPQRGWVTGVDYYLDGLTWVSCTSSGRITIHSTFDTRYKTKLKAIATRIKFCYKQDDRLWLLISLYKNGLKLLPATEMKMD